MKENYADIALRPDFTDLTLVLGDAPDFGGSEVIDPTFLSIPFLKQVVLAACEALAIARFLLFGRSMGGFAGLMLAHALLIGCLASPNLGTMSRRRAVFCPVKLSSIPLSRPRFGGGLSTE